MDVFKRLKQFYWPYRKYFIISTLTLIAVTAITMIYPLILKIMIDDVITAGRFEWVPYVAIGFFILMIIKGITSYYHQFYGDYFGIKAVYELRNALYRKLQYLSFKYYDNAKTGDLMSRLTGDVEAFRFFLSFGFAQIFNFILLLIFGLSIMLFLDVWLSLIVIGMLPFLAVAVYKFDQRVHPAFQDIRRSFAELTTKVQENISGINTVKSLAKEDYEIDRFSEKNEQFKVEHVKVAYIWAIFFPLMEVMGHICFVILLGVGGGMVISGQLQLGVLVAFFSYIWYIIGPMMQLGFIINMYSQSKAAGERLLTVLYERDLKAQHQTTSYETKNEDAMAVDEAQRLVGHVQFENVSHRYAEGDNLALENISVDATPGKVIGLIGATGSGKSTLVQLITRFYEPTQGSIYIDSKPLSDYSYDLLRRNIGVVFQESFLFSCSIKDNIAYGRPHISMDRIIDAAKRAQAHDFIMELPNGYDTILGERGRGLSGGQRQRLAIARSILIDPAILILDDATSAVDTQTEGKIQQAFREVMKGRTTFIIAHRISSIMRADEILVLDQGRMASRGTHQQLLSQSDIYRRIYDIQFKDYKEIAGEAI
jgi:ABC-type multidrug transport system fused ATPase/permease subunit